MRKLVRKNLSPKSVKPSYSILRHSLYLCLSMLALILSALFPVVDRQLMVLSVITGLKWVVADRTSRVNIIIKEKGVIEP